MYLYLIIIIIFLIINYLLSKLIKKYTYEKFFIYVVFYFILLNIVNLIYLKNIHLFTIASLFSVVILFLYSGLYRSISVKIMIRLYFKKANISINNFYKKEFKQRSFNKRVKILIDHGFLLKRNKYLVLSKKGNKYLKIFKIVHSFYKIKYSG